MVKAGEGGGAQDADNACMNRAGYRLALVRVTPPSTGSTTPVM